MADTEIGKAIREIASGVPEITTDDVAEVERHLTQLAARRRELSSSGQ